MREQFYNKILMREGIEIFDYGSLNWSELKYKRDNAEHYVNSYESDRPYVIASFYYGDKNMWDIICIINGIKDPLNIPVGTKLIIPNYDDISDFIFEQKNK